MQIKQLSNFRDNNFPKIQILNKNSFDVACSNLQDRDFLLKIRNGEFEFDELMQMVEQKMERIRELYAQYSLPDQPDVQKTENLLVQIREEFLGA